MTCKNILTAILTAACIIMLIVVQKFIMSDIKDHWPSDALLISMMSASVTLLGGIAGVHAYGRWVDSKVRMEELRLEEQQARLLKEQEEAQKALDARNAAKAASASQPKSPSDGWKGVRDEADFLKSLLKDLTGDEQKPVREKIAARLRELLDSYPAAA